MILPRGKWVDTVDVYFKISVAPHNYIVLCVVVSGMVFYREYEGMNETQVNKQTH